MQNSSNKKTEPIVQPVDGSVIHTHKDIVAQNNQVVNQDPALQVDFAKKAAKSLMVVIDATKPLVLQGKRYLYFEHWQTIARFFNTTVGIDSTTKDANGYIAKAVVYNKDGIIIGGAEASCMKDEMNWKNKPDFQLRSMAQTRAMSKALRSMYGFVAVLAGVEATPAEEMNGQSFTETKYTLDEHLNGEAERMEKDWQKMSKLPQRKPTEKQNWLIKKLCRDKHITQEQAVEMAKGKNPSEFIKALMEYQPSMEVPDEAINEIVPG